MRLLRVITATTRALWCFVAVVCVMIVAAVLGTE
jgi:hypothetical protein